MLTRDIARALDPIAFAKDCGVEPDPWQQELLLSDAPRVHVNCARQTGKSTICALLALHRALYSEASTILLVSPSLRQSSELFRKVAGFWHKITAGPEAEALTALRLELPNGSRILSLPGSEGTIRGYSCDLLVIDEAARVSDEVMSAVRPMLAVSNGRLLALSTPWGRRGWWFEAATAGAWHRIRVPASECLRISAEFLEQELRELGPLVFAAEYSCEFTDAEHNLFPSEMIARMFTPTVERLWA